MKAEIEGKKVTITMSLNQAKKIAKALGTIQGYQDIDRTLYSLFDRLKTKLERVDGC